MKTKITGFIYKNTNSWSSQPFSFFCFEMDQADYLMVGPHEFECEIPANFNPIAAEVAALEKELEKIGDQHMQAVCRIKEKISKLTCIENVASQA